MEINTKSMLAILKELMRVTDASYNKSIGANQYLEGTIDAYDGLIKMLERI